jgi:hypothetical protein
VLLRSTSLAPDFPERTRHATLRLIPSGPGPAGGRCRWRAVADVGRRAYWWSLSGIANRRLRPDRRLQDRPARGPRRVDQLVVLAHGSAQRLGLPPASALSNTGRWLLAPRHQVAAMTRRSRTGTLVLETEFETPNGSCHRSSAPLAYGWCSASCLRGRIPRSSSSIVGPAEVTTAGPLVELLFAVEGH